MRDGVETTDVSGLLLAWSDGDRSALDQLTPIVYRELHRLARQYMRRERPGHSLQTTALVHEAYIRLVDSNRMRWQNRAHFFAVCAQLMRRILVEWSRLAGYGLERYVGFHSITNRSGPWRPLSKNHFRPEQATSSATVTIARVESQLSRTLRYRVG
jgi:hypothetical protein